MLSEKIISSFDRADLAVDIGTSNTIVCAPNGGVVVNQPSMVAIDRNGGLSRVIGIGSDAKRLVGRAPNGVITVEPLSCGVVNDVEIAEIMIKSFIKKAMTIHSRLLAPKVVACVPSGATSVEQRAMRDAITNAGASEVRLIDAAYASAIGAGVDLEKPEGVMVINIGGGATEIGVFSVGGNVHRSSLRYGGNDFDNAIMGYFRRFHNFIVSRATAEQLKFSHGSAIPHIDGEEPSFTVRGIDTVKRAPAALTFGQAELYEATRDVVALIAEGIKRSLEDLPPELAADIYTNGIILTGGGALLKGFDQMISGLTGLEVRNTEDPLLCAAKGALAAIGSSAPARRRSCSVM